MTIKAAAAIAAIVLIAGAPAITLAAESTPDPIVVSHIDSTNVPEGTGPGFLSLSFENTSKQTVTEVTFEVSGDRSFRRIRDVGTFAPGVSIMHSYLGYSGPDEMVRVAQVEFADGSVWADGQTSAPGSRRQATSDSVSLATPF
jgi:hypothetical protein